MNWDPPRNSMPKLKPSAKLPPPRDERHEDRREHHEGGDAQPDPSFADERDRTRAGVEVVSEPLESAELHLESFPLAPVDSAGRFRQFCRLALGDGLSALRLAARSGAARLHGGAELGAAAVDRSERRRIEPAERMPAGEEPRGGEQLQHRVSEQDDDQHVDHGGEPERDGEALHVADRQDEQDDRGEQVDALGGENGADRALPARFDGSDQTAAVAQFVSDAFEVDDERVGREADRDDQAGDTGQREPVALAPGQDVDRQVGQQRRRRRATRP